MIARSIAIFFCAFLAMLLLLKETKAADGDSTESGVASVYGLESGNKTASGEPMRENIMAAAHRTLPFGTLVRVTNTRNGQSAVVQINDRGPFIKGRIIDVTPTAAKVLGFSGLVRVTLLVVK